MLDPPPCTQTGTDPPGSPDMVTTTSTHPLLRSAARHLYAAADRCVQHAGNDPTSPWHSLAGQMHLVAAGLASDAQGPTPIGDQLPVADHLLVALEILQAIPLSAGPGDLQIWQWRVVDLRDLVAAWDPTS